MVDDINTMITNATIVDKSNLAKNIKPIIDSLKEAIKGSKDIFKTANMVDEKNKNGFILDFEVVDNIFDNAKNEQLRYGDVTLSIKDEEKKIIYGKEIKDIGTVLVISDGNPYALIEIIIKNIMAGNAIIIANDGYMYGTNQLLIKIVNSVLEQYKISNHLVQTYTYEKIDDVLANYANIDLVVCIGNHEFQQLVLNKSKNRVLTSGYENFEIYIEDTTNINLINKIMHSGLNVTAYIKEDLYLDYPNSVRVLDLDEAIASINYTGSRYSAAIFTNSSENASRFLNEIHARRTYVNTSPTIERVMDLKVSDLTNEKTIIYPLNYKMTGDSIKIALDK